MSRTAEIIILCEDQQHQTFARLFFERMGWKKHKIRTRPISNGQGSAVQRVLNEFPVELTSLRQRPVAAYLVVLIDGDASGASARRTELDQACGVANIPVLGPADNVLLCVPTWNIETWLAYLDGEIVDETSKNYPRLERPRQSGRHVAALAQMCRERQLRSPFPPSLDAACSEYRRLFP